MRSLRYAAATIAVDASVRQNRGRQRAWRERKHGIWLRSLSAWNVCGSCGPCSIVCMPARHTHFCPYSMPILRSIHCSDSKTMRWESEKYTLVFVTLLCKRRICTMRSLPRWIFLFFPFRLSHSLRHVSRAIWICRASNADSIQRKHAGVETRCIWHLPGTLRADVRFFFVVVVARRKQIILCFAWNIVRVLRVTSRRKIVRITFSSTYVQTCFDSFRLANNVFYVERTEIVFDCRCWASQLTLTIVWPVHAIHL